MSEANDEHVLVFPANILDEVGVFQGFHADASPYIKEIFQPKNLSYLPRSIAETNSAYKQIIPYCVFKYGKTYFTYQRTKKSGESRLRGNYSIGIGGHVNREDSGDNEVLGYYSYLTGLHRESAEEIIVNGGFRENIAGVLYDASTPVGEVHFGIVHLFELETPQVTIVDDALADGKFLDATALIELRSNLENWTKFLVDDFVI
jgi:predicted NUDIX family phosphoesterase